MKDNPAMSTGTSMKASTARFVLGIAIPAASLAVLLVGYLVTRSALPDRLATHFDGSGNPDESMTPGAFLLFMLAFVVVGGGTCLWLARSEKARPASVMPLIGFLGGFFAGLGSAIGVVTFVSQRGIASWEQAGDVAWLIIIPLAVSAAVGMLAARSATALPALVPEFAAVDQPVMDLSDGQHAVWAATVHSKWLARLAAVAIVVGVLAAIGSVWSVALPAIAIGVVMFSLATFRVRADGQGLHVKYGALPWPRTTVKVSEIATATVIDVRPMEWGGWGYRGSLKLMKQAAVVHRAGPGIRLDLRNGKVFVVTVDDPQTPVALLNAEIERSAQPA